MDSAPERIGIVRLVSMEDLGNAYAVSFAVQFDLTGARTVLTDTTPKKGSPIDAVKDAFQGIQAQIEDCVKKWLKGTS